MKTKWKLKWVTALRSGKYRKGKNQLHSRGRYCCLGVLTDIVCNENSELDRAYLLCDAAALDNSIVEIVGLKSINPTVQYKDTEVTLAGLNDEGWKEKGKGLTFKKIADIIEEQL